MQVVGSVLNAQLGVAARIAALRRSSPDVCPQVPTLIAAEFPIIAVEAMLAALASFTLVVPLGLPWWSPVIGLVVVGAASVGLRRLALREGRKLWRGLAVLRSLNGGLRVVGLVLIAVFCQIAPQLAAAARGRCRSLGVGRHGGPDRPGHARTATGRAGGGRGRCGADSRQRRRGPRGRGRCAHHGHGNARRPLLRRLGGGRSLRAGLLVRRAARRRPAQRTAWVPLPNQAEELSRACSYCK